MSDPIAPEARSMIRYQIASADVGSKEVDAYLDAGFEPFSVVCAPMYWGGQVTGNSNVIWFRRATARPLAHVKPETTPAPPVLPPEPPSKTLTPTGQRAPDGREVYLAEPPDMGQRTFVRDPHWTSDGNRLWTRVHFYNGEWWVDNAYRGLTSEGYTVVELPSQVKP